MSRTLSSFAVAAIVLGSAEAVRKCQTASRWKPRRCSEFLL